MRIEEPAPELSPALEKPARWLRAVMLRGNRAIQTGSRVVLETEPGTDAEALARRTGLRIDRVVRPNLFVLQAADAWAAAKAAETLAASPGVRIAHPVRRIPMALWGPYEPMPNDPQFLWAWHLDDRDGSTGERLGFDLNVRAAWPIARGYGVTVAVADDGVELTHPDLAANAAAQLSYNFFAHNRNGMPQSSQQIHATAVAGLIAAALNNRRGSAGVAPEARLASWVVFDQFDNFVDEETSGEMFQFEIQDVWVQNHSWGNMGVEQLPLSALEDAAIEKAVTEGRGGRGVIIVRAAGNERESRRNVNDDGYTQDPRVIAVGAVRVNGRAAAYSTPGATVLVAAFSGDDAVDLPNGSITNYPSLFTTDRAGSLGYNRYDSQGLNDYAYGYAGFTGTSGSTPQIAGLCALILSANPDLTYRDVQQILILSARQLDLADPDLQRNGGGLLVSHNVGFGVPDAALAVALARSWSNRPPLVSRTVTGKIPQDIPDDGLRVEVSGLRLPPDIESIPAWPTDGPVPDEGIPSLPLVDAGQALEPIQEDLTGKAALIQRGGNYFVQKLNYAAQAGAAFAVIYNNQNGTERVIPAGADIQFAPIPAVFIDQNHGEALAQYVRMTSSARAAVRLQKAVYELPMNADVLCEHVRLHIQTTHPSRADLRITLVSPSGTRSVLQRINNDYASPLDEWDYYSTHHFFENSRGTWRVEVSDLRPGVTGKVKRVELTVYGALLQDADHDGLDDSWEKSRFGNLSAGPLEDPDMDGWNNMLEQILGTNPLDPPKRPKIDVGWWNEDFLRLSWPSVTNRLYRVFTADRLGPAFQPQPFTVRTNLPGGFPETEWLVPANAAPRRFFRIESTEIH